MNTRAVAARLLTQVILEGKILTHVLKKNLPSLPHARDRAFVQALCYGVVRWYWRLDRLLSALTKKPVEVVEVRMLALIGLYQLSYMRVKPYAAVSETVAAAQGHLRWAQPFLNGVLRSYQRSQSALNQQIESDHAVATAHPLWLVDILRHDWPDEYISLLHENNREPPLTLRVNLSHTSRTAYLGTLAQAGILAESSPLCDSAVTLSAPLPIEEIPRFSEGTVSVQDAAAQLAASLLEAKNGDRILDACAAPGGKMMHLLERYPGIQELVALEIIPDRTLQLQENIARAHLHVTLMTADATFLKQWWDGRQFDCIVLDVPCSATGVIRRRPDIKVRRIPSDITDLHILQRRLLEAVWPTLAPGGQLLYITCSLLRSENEEQISAFLDAHLDAKESYIQTDWGRAMRHGRQILTGESGMDGFYYARLHKTGCGGT